VGSWLFHLKAISEAPCHACWRFSIPIFVEHNQTGVTATQLRIWMDA
jgi:hypothetical protein